jgi:hypothetical protein
VHFDLQRGPAYVWTSKAPWRRIHAPLGREPIDCLHKRCPRPPLERAQFSARTDTTALVQSAVPPARDTVHPDNRAAGNPLATSVWDLRRSHRVPPSERGTCCAICRRSPSRTSRVGTRAESGSPSWFATRERQPAGRYESARRRGPLIRGADAAGPVSFTSSVVSWPASNTLGV